jgi:hypothetical protein
MPSGDGYHVIMAILLLLHEAPKNEPAHQHDRSKRFLEPLGWAARERVQPNSFRRRCGTSTGRLMIAVLGGLADL